MTRSEFIQRMTVIADELEASGAAPWTDAPTETTAAIGGGERAAAIFFRTYPRDYVWSKLPDLERQAWDEVFAMLSGRGGVPAIDVEARTNVACALMVEGMARADSSQRQLLMHVASQIRVRR